LLTYRESATDDGFFMLLVQPPVTLPDDQIIAKDVIVVLDQSGSMFGDKWDQARKAAEYVLQHLNPVDRFNVVLFSTGERLFSNQMESPDQAQSAIDWMRGQEAAGGTDINGALSSALDMADAERPTTILFLTDGLATEGEVDTQKIIDNVKAAARPNVRLFTFGVGDDVDTVLLDTLVRDQHGASSYVRPSERIDEEVSSLYNKISAPVLTDVTLDTSTLLTEDVYPGQPLPDLFAGTQLTLVGRYRGDASNLTFTLKGKVNGQEQTFVYSGLNFPAHAGGEPFIARLWATRRIGDLLNAVRLNGDNKELIDSIVHLSVRYGIITPYTSFLIQENDILSAQGMEEAQQQAVQAAQQLSAPSGAGAVNAADAAASLANANAPMPMALPTMTAGGQPVEKSDGTVVTESGEAVNPIQSIGDKTFILRDGIWTDTTFQSDTMETQKVEFLSDAYFKLLEAQPDLGQYFAIGDRVIVVLNGLAYEVTSATAP
jgi:Ca-activated chloride channel family protein